MGEQSVFLLVDKPIVNRDPKELKNHPLNKILFGDLNKDEYLNLKEDISKRGIQDPLHITKDDIIVSGHQRRKIALDLGINVPCIIRNDLVEDWQVEEQLISDNLLRRHLSDFQKVECGERLYNIEKIKAEIERRKKISEYRKTGETNLKSDTSKNDTLKKVGEKVGLKRDKYSKARKVYHDAPEPVKKKWQSGDYSTHYAYKETQKLLKQKEKEQKRKEKAEQGKNIKLSKNDIDFRHGDFVEVLQDIPDNSIDLILTDPPYPIDFIDEWEKLSEFASKKLKENGFLIAYCGHKNLYESMNRLNKHLDFYWIFSLIHSGNTKLIPFNNIDAGWKPILVYQKGFKKISSRVKDVLKGSKRSKDNHEWEQSEDELQYLIDTFSSPGDKILDPFAGSGTTLVRAKKMNRIPLGSEREEQTYNIAKIRMSELVF
jgi:site-specific DNA-methyltransferase (adenine-specific)